MTTAYTSLLGLALPVTGELSGTWGDTVNNSITSLLDSAIAGTTTITSDADVTLTTTTGSANTSRQAIILWTAGGTATRTIIAPAQSKIYTVINSSSSTQSIILAGAGPTSGVTIAKGESALCAWNGSDFIKISNTAGPGTFTNLTVTGNTTLGDAVTDTITVNSQFVTGTVLRSAQANTNTLSLAAYDVDGTAYTNLITLTAGNTPTLALTSTGVGTINNMSIGATTASTGAFTTLSASSTVTLSGGTINGVAFLNGSNVLTTGSALTFDGTNLGLAFTPSAWGSNWKAMQFIGNGSVVGRVDTLQLNMILNAFQNGTDFKYLSTGFATRYVQNGGAHQWINAPSGTAGDTVTFTTAMTLDASGNLGIGTTSPAYKLHAVKTGGGILGRFDNADGVADIYGYGLEITRSVAYIKGSGALQLGGANGYNDLVINSSGNVGIGTSSPTQVLDIQKSQAWATLTSTTGTLSSLFKSSNTGGSSYFGRDNSTGGVLGSSAYATVVYGSGAYPMTFHTNDTERARITSGGSLLVGTTSEFAKLSVIVPNGADRNLIQAGVTSATDGLTVKWNNATSTIRVNIQNLPTSATGLASGDLWNSGGTLKVA